MAKGDRCENCWHVFENEDENICPICFKHRVIEDEISPLHNEETLKEEKHNTEEYKTYEYDTNESQTYESETYESDTYEPDADKYEADSTTDLPPEHLTTYKKPGDSSALILGIMLIIIMSGIVVFFLWLFNSPHPSNSDEESSTNFNIYVDPYYANEFNFNEPIDYKDIEYTFSEAYNIGKTFKGIKAEEGKTFIAIKFSAMNTDTSDTALTTDFEYIDFAYSINNKNDYSAYLAKNISGIYDLDFTSHNNIVLKSNNIFDGYYVIQVSNSDSFIGFEFGLSIFNFHDSETSKHITISDSDIKELKIN